MPCSRGVHPGSAVYPTRRSAGRTATQIRSSKLCPQTWQRRSASARWRRSLSSAPNRYRPPAAVWSSSPCASRGWGWAAVLAWPVVGPCQATPAGCLSWSKSGASWVGNSELSRKRARRHPGWSVLLAPTLETPAVEGARHAIGLSPVVPAAEQLAVPQFSRSASAPGVYVIGLGSRCRAPEPEGRLVLAPATGLADELLLLGPAEEPGGVPPVPLVTNVDGEAQDAERSDE